MKRATLNDIAKEVGVSKMSVSKALNGQYGVSTEMAKKIKETANRLDYTPNLMARGIKNMESKTIGVITSDSSHSFFPLVIKGIEETASVHGYNILLSNTNSDMQTEMNNIKMLISKRVDGIILVVSTLVGMEYKSFFEDCRIPIVFAVRRSEFDGFDCLVNDNVYGARMITDYMINKGDRRVHFINLMEYSPSAKDRLLGYRLALEDNSIEFDKSLVSNIPHTIDDGKNTMKKILSEETPKAVFCGCDIVAIGAMEVLLNAGLRIPEDVRLGSYDNIAFSEYFKVPLTTVSQPKYEIGAESAKAVIERIRKPGIPKTVLLKPELIIRKSC